ncbi:MAG: PLP-dependent transferase [Chloroflexi bacterium]|nr:PLP-dependent transferase [Chloroflexota bacterium]
MSSLPPNYSLGTHAIHAGEEANAHRAHVGPIYLSSTFTFPDVETGEAIMGGKEPGYSYSRTTNPTVQQLAEKYALLEGIDLLRGKPERPLETVVRATPFASGMAAISSGVLGRLRAGETLLAQSSLYNIAFSLFTEVLPRFNVEVVWVEEASPESWERALKAHPRTSLLYIETPSNPVMRVQDIAALADLAHHHDAWLMADNTFATPYCQRPLDLGADLVAHSTTKYLSGHGTHLGGALVSPHLDFMTKDVADMLKNFGGVPSPMDCWLGILGLKTFALRMERHCLNAMTIAHYLDGHPKVAAVNYPGLDSHPDQATARKQMIGGFGGMMSFELKGGAPAARVMLNALRIPAIATSLGTVGSLIQLSATMNYAAFPPETRARLNVADGLIRFSVGIEDAADILDDLDQALAKC